MNSLNEQFVSIIKEQIPNNKQLISTLMGALPLGKESIYRRLRSEIPFSFEEVIKVSIKLGISLDNVIIHNRLTNKSKWAVLNLDNIFSASDFFNLYYSRMEDFLHILCNMIKSPNAKIRYAVSNIPVFLLIPYKKLNLFNFYKWSYLKQGIGPEYLFSKVIKPSNAFEIEKKVLEKYRQVQQTLFIIDKNIFLSIISDIIYFYERQLITDSERKELKEELFELVSYLESIATLGSYKEGGEVTIYLSNTTIDTNYHHFEYGNQSICGFEFFFIDFISIDNKRLCLTQKEWIKSLKRYSVLISQSNEDKRFDFFREQRKMIDKLL